MRMSRTKELVSVGIILVAFASFVSGHQAGALLKKQIDDTKHIVALKEFEYHVALKELSLVVKRLAVLGHFVDMIIHCESSGVHDVWGKAGEYGVAQFKEATFYWLAKKAGIDAPDWKSEKQQRFLLTWSLINGYGEHWTCYDTAMKKWRVIKNQRAYGG